MSPSEKEKRRGADQEIFQTEMDWLEKLVHPVKQALVAVSPRSGGGKKNEMGIQSLQGDVQSCEYEDVQVMWGMLRTEMEQSAVAAKRRK